ncbi:MAG TPA: SH3 domain-containing protein, partial [Candidatus Limnocylindria bacterium]|nr:SH3 domain-containing protein [Candidatus Limnocylindria bacterium]
PSPSAQSIAPSPSASLAEPTASVEPSSSPRPSPKPSASPDPPQAELAEGWARLNTGQELHSNATEDSPIVVTLPPRQVVWVSSGPYREDADDDRDWYSIETLDEKYGWIASGPPDDPLATTISNRFNFRSCGAVKVLDKAALVNGLRTERLDAVERASFELAEAMGTTACQRFSNEDYEPSVRLELFAHACGAPRWDGSVATLQPTTAGSVDATWRVPSTITIPDQLLTNRQRTDANGFTNAQKLMILASRQSSPFACVSTQVINDRYDHMKITTEMAGCLEMTARDTSTATFVVPGGGGEPVTLFRSYRDGISDILLNDPTNVGLTQKGGTLKADVLGDC